MAYVDSVSMLILSPAMFRTAAQLRLVLPSLELNYYYY